VSRAPAERPGQSKTDAVQTRRPKSPSGDDIAARTRFVGVGADGLVLHALRAAVGNASGVQCGRRLALVGAAPHRLAGARGRPNGVCYSAFRLALWAAVGKPSGV
jgi:hypothetical protein